MIPVTSYGAVGDNITDDRAAIQACFDANPAADILIPGPNTYLCTAPIYLSDITGRNFRGNIYSDHGVLRFSNAGSSTDTDAAMQNGLVAYTRQLSAGGDLQGIQNVSIEGLSITGPANGCGLRICNSNRVNIRRNTFLTNRYGVVQESCNTMVIEENAFQGYANAALGFLYTANPNIWYGTAGINSYFNDGPIVKGNNLTSGVVGALAHILDHGSNAECVRTFEGNVFFNAANNCAAFGYLGRNVSPSFLGGDWFENVNYPIRILSDNGSEAYYFPGNFPGVTAAQPSGTYSATSLPNKVSIGGAFHGMFFSHAVDDMNLTGLSYGPSTTGQHFSTSCSHRHIVIRPIGGLSLTDMGSLFYTNGGGSYMDAIAAQYYRDLSKVQVGAANSGGSGFRMLRVPN